MVQKKQGWPEEGELVIATVTKIQYHSVFCVLDEYDRSGMIHISEIAPGRIKSIHEYVREGKTLVLKVLRIDKSKGHIDLSLRRVTEAQRRNKAAQLKQQQVVSKIVEQFCEGKKADAATVTKQLEEKLGEYYPSAFDAFQAVVEGSFSLTEAGIDEKIAKGLEVLVKERIKPKEVEIKGEFSISCWAPNGAQIISKAFADTDEGVQVSYAGGGRYTTIVHAADYKTAEGHLQELIDHVKEAVTHATVSFERTDR